MEALRSAGHHSALQRCSAAQASPLCHHQHVQQHAQHRRPVSMRWQRRLSLATRAQLPAATAAAARVLFVGGLPALTPAATLEQQLIAVCAAAGCAAPSRVQVVPFDSEEQRSRFSAGWLHKGFALLAFRSEAALDAAAAAIASGVSGLTAVGPARKVPADWPPELTCTAEELAALQEQQAALEVRRAHNKRQRQRQSQRLTDSVEQLLQGLGSPFGFGAAQQYQPLLSETAQQLLLQAACLAQPGPQQDAGAQLPPLPPRMQDCLRWERVAQLVQQQQQQQQPSTQHGPIQLERHGTGDVEARLLLDWARVPASLDPAFGGQLADADVVRAGRGRLNARALRKRVQVESFALLLWQLLPLRSARGLTVVECGSGSGNLVLPLAHLLPDCCFVAVDMKPSAVRLLQQRVEQGGLTNVEVQLRRIETYTGPADVVLALHACGSATDFALEQAVRCRASLIVSSCCVGKIGKQQGLQYPRSRSLQQHMMRYHSSAAADSSSQPSSSRDLFQLLAATADYSHADQHSHPQLAALAKSNVELDRGMRVAEDGWRVALTRLLQPELTAKSDVLVGVPPVTTAAGSDGASVVPPWHWA